MEHRSCGQSHAPFTPCPPDRRKLLATEADELATRCDQLAQRVTSEVDRIAAQPARDAALRLVELSDLLDGAVR